MTLAPFDNPIVFDKLEGFTPVIRPLADGMRASLASECPSCAIIEFIDPTDERVFGAFNPGVATMGHLLHQAWAWQAFDEYTVEAAIPWKHGVSHDDVIVHAGEWAGAYEVKTHSEPKPKAPSLANRRQCEFRMRLRERAGLPIPGPTRLVMIGKAGRESGWVRGPWEVDLTDERREQIDITLDAIDAFLDTKPDLHGEALKALANDCTRCFPKPVVAPVRTADGWIGRYVRLKREHDAIDDQRKVYAEAKKQLAVSLAEAKAELEKLVPSGVVVEGMSGTATRTRAGVLVVKGADVVSAA